MDREIPPRIEIKRALRATGLSDRQVDALLRDGWRALVGETKAENDELRDVLAQLNQQVRT